MASFSEIKTSIKRDQKARNKVFLIDYSKAFTVLISVRTLRDLKTQNLRSSYTKKKDPQPRTIFRSSSQPWKLLLVHVRKQGSAPPMMAWLPPARAFSEVPQLGGGGVKLHCCMHGMLQVPQLCSTWLHSILRLQL